MVGIALVLSYALARGVEWRGAGDIHTNMEIAATLLAFMVGIMALVRFYSKKDNTFLFVGTGFLGTAFLDGYHAVVTSHYFKDRLVLAGASEEKQATSLRTAAESSSR